MFILISIFLFVIPPIYGESYTNITVVDAKNMIDTTPSLNILDVRTQSEYDSGHIRHAKLIPVAELDDRVGELNNNDPILVYCRSGARSITASQILVDNGFQSVYNMLGGIAAWGTEGYPIVRSTDGGEIDAVGVVYDVIDGDTFDAFPVGRVRLADIDAPESGETGYSTARDFLLSTLDQELVYLDVDNVGVMDPYHRLVCVIYIRYNQTYLLNVNQALFTEGHAEIVDFDNEFNPQTWSLFIYYPTTVLPNSTYHELVPMYIDAQSDYFNMLTDYNALNGEHSHLVDAYETYQSTHSHSNTEYDTLDSSYTQYVENHAYANTEYTALQNQSAQDLGTAQTLNYVMMAITLVFIVSTIYLTIRKPKVNPKQQTREANK